MLHGETYMTQRTFNEINTSPTLFGQGQVESMEPEPEQKTKRGRKRHCDEEHLSEADRIKKEKNRKAAQKCREKKEKEAKDLKNRNEELEKDNKKLSDEKKKLEDRAQEFYRIIKEHMNKGCKLPPDVQEIFTEETKMISSNSNSEDCEIFRAVGTIEIEHTPPCTPDGLSSESQSPHLQYQLPNFTRSDFTRSDTAAPTALFSGTPLTDQEITRGRSGSSSRSSSSSSPAPPLSPAKAVPHKTGKHHSYLFTASKVAPKSPIWPESEQNGMPYMTHFSREIVPTVVSDFDNETDNTTEYISKSFEIIDRGGLNRMNISTSKIIETALQMQDVPCVDEVTKPVAMESSNTLGNESSQNLSSLGFSCVADYSYAEDLQQMESVQEIIEYTNVNQSRNQSLARQTSSGPSGHSENQPVVNVSACASALLDIGKDMSESLQQQIKISYSKSASSVSGTVSVSGLTQQTRQIANQQNVALHSEQRPVQFIVIKNKPGVEQQKLYTVKGQQKTADGSAVKNKVENSNESQALNYQPSDQLTLVSSEQIQAFMKSNLITQTHPSIQNQHAGQSQGTSQLILNQESQQLLRHISGPQPMINPGKQIQSSMLPRLSSEKLPIQQENQQQLTIRSAARKLIPAKVISKDNSSIGHVQTLGYVSSETDFQHPSIDYLVTAESVVSSGSQYHYAIKESVSKGYVFTQASEVSSHSDPTLSTTQTLVAGESDVSAYTSDNTDYSANVQDLPSLNLLELHSDNNLFEKRRSGLTS